MNHCERNNLFSPAIGFSFAIAHGMATTRFWFFGNGRRGAFGECTHFLLRLNQRKIEKWVGEKEVAKVRWVWPYEKRVSVIIEGVTVGGWAGERREKQEMEMD